MFGITRIFDFLQYRSKNYGSIPSLGSKENGKWITYMPDEVKNICDNLSYGLMQLGLERGDKIAIISNNRPEWNFADFGMQQCGVINVPVYTTLTEPEYAFIFNDAEVKYCFVSDESLLKKVRNIQSSVPSLKDIYTFNKIEGAKHYSELVLLGEKNKNESKLEAIKQAIAPNDLATILYTSGTTGNPKGVMLSHNNLVSNVIAVRDLPKLPPNSVALSFLPLCHSYERILTYLYSFLGFTVYYAESLEKIVDNIKELKPHAFSCVPRLIEKVYDRIMDKGKELTGVKKALFFWAVDVAMQFEKGKDQGWWFNKKLSIANKLIFSKWREALGGNVRAMISGGAALNPKLARIFWAADIPVLEGYGLTETSPVIAVNNFLPNSVRFGTVGPVIEGVTVKIADDGEILCKGPNVMLGYYKRPDLTDEVIDSDGWFHTGDIGVIVENRFLKITDRKKEIFKTSGGKYIAPQALENKLKESRFIEQAMVVGESQKFASAIIVPAFLFVREWAERKGLALKSNEDLIASKDVHDRIKEEIIEVNKSLAQYETIKDFILLPKEWSVDSGELTPKMSLKRKIIYANNLKSIETIYANLSDGSIGAI